MNTNQVAEAVCNARKLTRGDGLSLALPVQGRGLFDGCKVGFRSSEMSTNSGSAENCRIRYVRPLRQSCAGKQVQVKEETK